MCLTLYIRIFLMVRVRLLGVLVAITVYNSGTGEDLAKSGEDIARAFT